MKIFELFLPREDLALLSRLLLDRWRKYAPLYSVAFFFMFIVAGATALSAWLMKDVVNLIFVERERSALYWLPAIVIGDKEMASGKLVIRDRMEGSKQREMTMQELIDEIKAQVKDKPYLPLNLPKYVSTRPQIMA